MKNQKYYCEYDFSDPKKDFEDLKVSNALARFDELLSKHTAENVEYSSKQIASFLFVRAYCEAFTYRHRGKIVMPHVETMAIFPHNNRLV